MKATFEQLNETATGSFLYRRFRQPKFSAPYHFHPELELTLILEGHGRRMVGRHISSFEQGDLVLLGPNLPHTWLNDTSADPQEHGQAIVIQFKEHFTGGAFWDLPEMTAIQALLQKAQSGIWIKGKTRDWAVEKMIRGLSLPPFQKLLQLLEILHGIAVSDETEQIDFQFSHQIVSAVETDRFQRVYTYLIEHYREEISLATVAAMANLTPTSFCRFFKKITRKTFVDVLTELRIKYACQLLSTTLKPIADICFESGFGNLSYFNKEFKKSLGHSPLGYRKMRI